VPDNVILNTNTTTGATIRTVNLGGIQTQVAKVDIGGEGSEVFLNGVIPVRLQDGSGNAITSDARGGERPLSVQILDASGAQVTAFGGSGGTASNVGSAVPSLATAAGFSDGTNLQLARVVDADTGGGTHYTQEANLVQRSSGGPVETGVAANPLQVSLANTGANSTSIAVASQPKTPFTFRVQITSQQVNIALVTPGAAFRITSISITSKIGSSNPPDNPSMLIGIGASTTPTNSQVIYAHPSFPIGSSDHVMVTDIAEGGSSDKVLITTGAISVDVLEVFGTGYLK
jgi:hypothetical protein